jgi:hypothetical protein
MMDTTKKEKIDGNTNLINELSVTGKMPESGEIYINESGEVALYAVYDVTCYTKTFKDNDLIEATDTKTCKDNVLLSFNDYYNAGYNQGVADTKQGTAKESDVLAGVTFTSENGVNLIGSMANNGELNWKPTGSTTYIITPGYYSGGTLDSQDVYTTGYNQAISDVGNVFIAGTISGAAASYRTWSTYTTVKVYHYNDNYVSVSNNIITFKKASNIMVCMYSAAYLGSISYARLYYNGAIVYNGGSNHEVARCQPIDAEQNSTLYYQIATDEEWVRGGFYIYTR